MKPAHPYRFAEPIATAVPGLVLRPLAADDLAAIETIAAEPSVAEWWRDELDTEDSLDDYIDDPGLSPFAVHWNNAIAGYAQIYHANSVVFWRAFDVPPETYGLDMFLSTSAQGRGLGLAVTKALIGVILKRPGITRIHIDPDPRNARAIAVYTKAGFLPAGTHPGYGHGTRMLYMTLDRSKGPETRTRHDL